VPRQTQIAHDPLAPDDPCPADRVVEETPGQLHSLARRSQLGDKLVPRRVGVQRLRQAGVSQGSLQGPGQVALGHLAVGLRRIARALRCVSEQQAGRRVEQPGHRKLERH